MKDFKVFDKQETGRVSNRIANTVAENVEW
jgi:hypothetical protein